MSDNTMVKFLVEVSEYDLRNLATHSGNPIANTVEAADEIAEILIDNLPAIKVIVKPSEQRDL